jgi:hypothetical protein
MRKPQLSKRSAALHRFLIGAISTGPKESLRTITHTQADSQAATDFLFTRHITSRHNPEKNRGSDDIPHTDYHASGEKRIRQTQAYLQQTNHPRSQSWRDLTRRGCDQARLNRIRDTHPLLLLEAIDDGWVVLDRDGEWNRLCTPRNWPPSCAGRGGRTPRQTPARDADAEPRLGCSLTKGPAASCGGPLCSLCASVL